MDANVIKIKVAIVDNFIADDNGEKIFECGIFLP